jgi:hypothetical protein
MPGERFAGRDAYSANFASGKRRQPAAARPASAKDAPITFTKARRSSSVASAALGLELTAHVRLDLGVAPTCSTERQ